MRFLIERDGIRRARMLNEFAQMSAPNDLEDVMNWDRIEGNWKQLKGRVQQQWGKLTDDDFDQINGKRVELVGKVQSRYGYARDKAEAEVDDFCNSCK